MVAELDGAVVGYVFFSRGYNTDFAGRAMWLNDLFVAPAARGRGVGYALMAAVAAESVRQECVSLEWGVHTTNLGALEFYRRIGAETENVRIFGVHGERLHVLAGRRL
jgi:GNAT superfamily N-acetyltransferase